MQKTEKQHRSQISRKLTRRRIQGVSRRFDRIREHMGLDGKTPAEACGITIHGQDKWKTLIQNAKRN